ncbi:hypothetical protein ACLOJK_040478 [Asimina triloba]
MGPDRQTCNECAPAAVHRQSTSYTARSSSPNLTVPLLTCDDPSTAAYQKICSDHQLDLAVPKLFRHSSCPPFAMITGIGTKIALLHRLFFFFAAGECCHRCFSSSDFRLRTRLHCHHVYKIRQIPILFGSDENSSPPNRKPISVSLHELLSQRSATVFRFFSLISLLANWKFSPSHSTPNANSGSDGYALHAQITAQPANRKYGKAAASSEKNNNAQEIAYINVQITNNLARTGQMIKPVNDKPV